MRERQIAYPLSCRDRLEIGNTDEGGVARWSMRSNRKLVTLSGASSQTDNLVPAGCTVHGISMAVNTAVTDDAGDDTWSASLVGGVTGSLLSAAPPTLNGKYNVQVSPAAGGRTRARLFNGVNQYFSHANDAAFDWGAGDHSGILFCKGDVLGVAICPIIGAWDYASNKCEWAVLHTLDGLRFWASNDGATLYYTSSLGTITLDPGIWYTIYWYKEAGVGIGIEVNASGNVSTGAMVPVIFSSDVEFQLGSVVDVSGVTGYWQGLIGEVRLYSRLLTPAERLTFHEGGTPGTEATNLDHKYMLDAYTGNALDSVGVKHLTNNNTVGTGEGPGLTNVKFTPNGGSFSAGVIEVVAYYEQLTSLADA